jgi:hypothetical protein
MGVQMSMQQGAGIEACSPIAVSVAFAESAHQNHLYFIVNSSLSA